MVEMTLYLVMNNLARGKLIMWERGELLESCVYVCERELALCKT